MKKLNIVVLTFLTISLCFSQDKNPATQNISVSIDQSMLNNFFNAIGFSASACVLIFTRLGIGRGLEIMLICDAQTCNHRV